ncbi:hypothetical protein HDU93_000388 [Gonapodya sp. JEL0774]|nr:hypothetical protein HDU93_000388 [Gonapodya sp. JEL0774]
MGMLHASEVHNTIDMLEPTPALIYVDGNPKSPKNTLSRAHGRTDLLYLVVKLLLVFVWQFLDSTSTKLGILVVCLFALVKETVQKQPFHNATLQEIRSGIFFAAFVMSLISLACDVSGLAATDSLVPLCLLAAIVVPSILAGAFLNRAVRTIVTRQIYARFKAKMKDMRGTGKSFATMKYNNSGRRVTLDGQSLDGILDRVEENIFRLTTEKSKYEPPIFNSPYDVELACRFVRDSEDPDSRILVRELMEAAFLQYPKDGMVLIEAALYLLAFPEDTTAVHRPDETNAEKAFDLLEKIFNINVAFDVRFMGFVCEKLAEQSQKSKEVQKSDLNFSSFIEISSQEKYAKIYHIASLTELKAFWTCVRRATTNKDYLKYPDYLNSIASATARARDNYQRLITRFPKSKNMLRLFADFNRTVLADSEECRRLLSVAEELENAALNNSEDDSISDPESELESGSLLSITINGQSGNENGTEASESDGKEQTQEVSMQDRRMPHPRKAASSHGDSQATGESREARRARANRLEFVKRLVHVPRNYRTRLQALSVICLVLTSFAFGYTNTVFHSLSADVDSFLTTTEIGRTALATIQAARLMTYFASTGDSTNYNRWKQDLANQNNQNGNISLPYLVSSSSDTSQKVQVKLYSKITNDYHTWQPETAYMNQFQVASRVNEYARSLLAEVRVTQLKYLKFLQSIPAKVLDEILLTIDEQLEFLTEDDVDIDEKSLPSQDAGRDGRQGKESLILGASLLALCACGCAILIPAVVRLPINATFVDVRDDLINYTGGRKFMVRMTRTLGYEVLLGGGFWRDFCGCPFARKPAFHNEDNSTWTFGEQEMHMKDYIVKLKTLHEDALTGHGEVPHPPTTSIPIVHEVLEGWGCKIDNCDPAVRTYNESYGFSLEEALSPVDQQLADYIQNAEEFLVVNALKATHNFADPRILYMEAIQHDIVAGLREVDHLILKDYLPQGNTLASSASIALFVLTVSLFGAFYVRIYNRLIEEREAEMETVVTLIQTIPLHSAPEKFVRLVQSAGASSEDD